MKIKFAIAILFLLIGCAGIADWIIFFGEHSGESFENMEQNYVNRFPVFVQHLYQTHPPVITITLF